MYLMRSLHIPTNYSTVFDEEKGIVHSPGITTEYEELTAKSHLNAVPIALSENAQYAIQWLKGIKDIILYSGDLLSFFSAEELTKEQHILYWMNVIAVARYSMLVKNPDDDSKTIALLNEYYPHKPINEHASRLRYIQTFPGYLYSKG